MGVGPNFDLVKAFIASGATAYAFGEVVEVTGDATVQRAVTANAVTIMGICQEQITAQQLSDHPDKIELPVALEGLVRVAAGAAVAMGDRVTNDATARAVTRVKAIAGAQPLPTFGIALTAATAAGQHIDVQLTPGNTY